jgi:hypothetical protein
MLDINTEPIPDYVRERLQYRGHNWAKLTTIKSLLNYFLFSFGIRVYLSIGKEDETDRRRNPRWEINLTNLDPISGPTPHLLNQATISRDGNYNNEVALWSSGLRAVVEWINYNRHPEFKTMDYHFYVWTFLFGHFNHYRINLLKNALTSHSATKNRTFKFENVDNVNPLMAKHLIDYVEFMLGPADLVQADIIFPEAVNTTSIPVGNGSTIVIRTGPDYIYTSEDNYRVHESAVNHDLFDLQHETGGWHVELDDERLAEFIEDDEEMSLIYTLRTEMRLARNPVGVSGTPGADYVTQSRETGMWDNEPIQGYREPTLLVSEEFMNDFSEAINDLFRGQQIRHEVLSEEQRNIETNGPTTDPNTDQAL